MEEQGHRLRESSKVKRADNLIRQKNRYIEYKTVRELEAKR